MTCSGRHGAPGIGMVWVRLEQRQHSRRLVGGAGQGVTPSPGGSLRRVPIGVHVKAKAELALEKELPAAPGQTRPTNG